MRDVVEFGTSLIMSSSGNNGYAQDRNFLATIGMVTLCFSMIAVACIICCCSPRGEENNRLLNSPGYRRPESKVDETKNQENEDDEEEDDVENHSLNRQPSLSGVETPTDCFRTYSKATKLSLCLFSLGAAVGAALTIVGAVTDHYPKGRA